MTRNEYRFLLQQRISDFAATMDRACERGDVQQARGMARLIETTAADLHALLLAYPEDAFDLRAVAA